MIMKHLKILVAFSLSAVACSGFCGGGGGSIVFDPSNYAQNIVTAAESLKATGDRAVQIRTQYLQYATQLKQLQSMAAGDLVKMRADNAQDIQNITGYINSVRQTQGDVQRTRDLLLQRFNEQSLSGLSWQAYLQAEGNRIRNGVQAATDRAEIDRVALEKVARDYQQARAWGEKIDKSAGMHESMQLMNAQMNKVVTQNAEVIKSLTMSSMQTNDERTDALARQKASRDLEDQAFRRWKAEHEKAGAALDSWQKR